MRRQLGTITKEKLPAGYIDGYKSWVNLFTFVHIRVQPRNTFCGDHSGCSATLGPEMHSALRGSYPVTFEGAVLRAVFPYPFFSRMEHIWGL